MWVRGLKQTVNDLLKHFLVAPYVGAWIETYLYLYHHQRDFVAPYVGAWIETAMTSCNTSKSLSHPMWVRGLKLSLRLMLLLKVLSHPMWVRGLKHNTKNFLKSQYVAPYVGAWIETIIA